jgi:dephospho-CoA kinase
VSVLTVALTGGIATGKSVVARILADHGCFVQSADRLAHDLMTPGRPAWRQIVAHFGRDILNPDRTVNRARLGTIIFSSVKERDFLNRLIHPLVLAKKKRAIRALEKKGTHRIFVSEAALTVESGFAPFFDKVIVVHCPERLQVERLMKRDGMTRRDAWKRLRSQMPTAEKVKRGDYLIETSGSADETIAQTERVYKDLLADFRKKRADEKRPPVRSRPRARRRAAEP